MISGELRFMFQGQVAANVGAFFRIAFPKHYREKLGGTIILTYGFENSLIATNESKSEELFNRELEDKSFFSEKVREIRRVFLGGITSIEFDSQGRFIVPEYLREHARIKVKSEAIFVWQRDYIEIWDKETWNKRQSIALKNLTLIGENLSRRGVDE